MVMKQLHDEGPTLIQCSAQRRVRNPVQFSRGNLAFWTWFHRKVHQTSVRPSRHLSIGCRCRTRHTCSVEGKYVSLTLGGALGGVGLWAAAGQATSLSPRGARVFPSQLKVWRETDAWGIMKGKQRKRGRTETLNVGILFHRISVVQI